MRCLLLGLERRPDRRLRCEAMLQAELPWLKVEFFPATDGSSVEIPEGEVARTWNTRRNARFGEYEDVRDSSGKVVKTKQDFEEGVDYYFSPGERGCAHSHLRMWRTAAAATEPTLIIEDDLDILFRSGCCGARFTERLRLGMAEAEQNRADVLYLTWAGFREGNFRYFTDGSSAPGSVLRRAEYVWTTVAYVIWPRGARKLLDAAPLDQPVDNFMAWECSQGRLRSYVLLDGEDKDTDWEGGIARQKDFVGDTDIPKSDGGHQNDDPLRFLVPS